MDRVTGPFRSVSGLRILPERCLIPCRAGGTDVDDRTCHVFIVSCDIVGHSREADHAIQVRRIVGLNGVVRTALSGLDQDGAVWASGGDGGHVLFSTAHLQQAVTLARDLRVWAQDEHVPLRVTCHLGTVSYSVGADGRTQPIGQGINHAGAILAAAGDQGIVASDAFREAVETAGLPGALFHEPRTLCWRNKGPHRVCLMSLPDAESRWPEPAETVLPQGPIGRSNAWETLHRAHKRLQINGADTVADTALRELQPEHLRYDCDGQDGDGAKNPFFGHLDNKALREVVRIGHLVERGYNEVICHYGDAGNTMFVILRGQVGVFHRTQPGEPRSGEPDFVMQRGQVVGELAFALNRRRTADLITLSDTALLAFSFKDFFDRLGNSPGSEQTRVRVHEFITSRVLEHVATNVPYLVGHDHTGPLAHGDARWESVLGDMLPGCRILTRRATDGPLTLEALGTACPDTRGEGLFVLVSGRLSSRSNSAKRLKGEDLPLLYVNVPGSVVFPDHEYALSTGPANILHIGTGALDELEERSREAVIAAVKGEVARRYFYDVFISYNFLGDSETALRWSHRLRDEGLRVFVDEPEPGTHFTEHIQASLLDSVILLAFVSPHAMAKPLDRNWVQKEINFRVRTFEDPYVVPVVLPGGDIEQFDLPYTNITVSGQEDGAIAQVIDVVRRIREGRKEPPMLTRPTLTSTIG